MTVFLLVSFLYPNGHELRPALELENVFQKAVWLLYQADTPTNILPSVHVFNMEISKTKSVDKITVKDLVEACHISRQTFYYHFQDIIEVIEWSVEQAFEGVPECGTGLETLRTTVTGFRKVLLRQARSEPLRWPGLKPQRTLYWQLMKLGTILPYGTGNVILLYRLEKYVLESGFYGSAGKIFPGVPEMKGSTYEKFTKNSGNFCSFYTCLYGNCIVSVSK